MDKFSEEDIELLLGPGRRDDSGDFTEGAYLHPAVIEKIRPLLHYTVGTVALVRGSNSFLYLQEDGTSDASELCERIGRRNSEALGYWLSVLYAFQADFSANIPTHEGYVELLEMFELIHKAGYSDRIVFDPSVIRGLEYYTGPIFECELLPFPDAEGRTARFGSVGGGGRYDDLVARFTGQKVPATGFSIGVSRLFAALQVAQKARKIKERPLVVVLVLDKPRQSEYWSIVRELRRRRIRAEMYVGTAGMKAQMKYADKRGAALVVIQGSDEKARGEVQIKDLRLGAELASNIASHEEYASQRLAQFSVPEADLVSAVKKALAR
ncbi:MAG: ATP phosphoribosyltransferase regulatory subunit [Aestuariivirga sp.]|nr:ATP phosphoribosyltransferase regulatory subunit [Aestuariivirga sp.]